MFISFKSCLKESILREKTVFTIHLSGHNILTTVTLHDPFIVLEWAHSCNLHPCEDVA